MYLRQGSRSIPSTVAMHAHHSSNGHILGAIDSFQPPVPSHEAALDGSALVSREAEAAGAVPDSSHTDPRAATPALQPDRDGIAALRSQPELAATSERRTSRPHTGTDMASQIPDSSQNAPLASNEQDAATQSMSVEAQHAALPTQHISGGVHALEPPDNLQGEAQSGDWREQQHRWLQTPSGLAEAAGLRGNAGSQTSTVAASRDQSDVGLEDRLPGLGNQQSRSLNPIKVSDPQTPASGFGPSSACGV